jgi:hypothetical protein
MLNSRSNHNENKPSGNYGPATAVNWSSGTLTEGRVSDLLYKNFVETFDSTNFILIDYSHKHNIGVCYRQCQNVDVVIIIYHFMY